MMKITNLLKSLVHITWGDISILKSLCALCLILLLFSTVTSCGCSQFVESYQKRWSFIDNAKSHIMSSGIIKGDNYVFSPVSSTVTTTIELVYDVQQNSYPTMTIQQGDDEPVTIYVEENILYKRNTVGGKSLASLSCPEQSRIVNKISTIIEDIANRLPQNNVNN